MFTQKSYQFIGHLSVVLAAAILTIHCGIPVAHAQVAFGGAGPTTGGSLGSDLVKIVGYLAYLNVAMHILLLIVLQLLQYLLQADFFNDPVMMKSLYTIWQLSRDIMNVVFAVMLIGVSFYVIITANTEMIKSKIVQFVVAVVLVNLSWFFPRVIIDVANIMTATVYSIPQMIPDFTCKTLDDKAVPTASDCTVITSVLIFPTPVEAIDFRNKECGGDPIACPCLISLECHKIEKYTDGLSKMSASHAMINGMAISFAKISLLPKVPEGIADFGGGVGGKTAADVSLDIAISVLIAFCLQVSVLLPLVGLAIGFLVRIIVLWVTTAFMPFSFLGYVINGKLGTNIFEFETDIWKEFINAAFLPVMVAVPFVIGFIMLSTVANIPVPGAFPMTWSVPLIGGVKSWWALLWMVAAIAIIWTGSFKALSKSQIASKMTDKVKGFGEGIFSQAVKLPLLTPLPFAGKGTNIGTAVSGMKAVKEGIRLTATGVTGKSLPENIRAAMGKGVTPDPTAMAKSLGADKANSDRIVKAIEELKNNPAVDKGEQLRILREATGMHERSLKEIVEHLKKVGEEQGRLGDDVAPHKKIHEKEADLRELLDKGKV